MVSSLLTLLGPELTIDVDRNIFSVRFGELQVSTMHFDMALEVTSQKDLGGFEVALWKTDNGHKTWCNT